MIARSRTNATVYRASSIACLALWSLTVVPRIALAQLDPGAARGLGEAPGGRLADDNSNGPTVPATPNPSHAIAQGVPVPSDSPAAAPPERGRSMAFSAGGAECRETVPGGRMLAIAYALAVVFLGLYVGLVASKSASIGRRIDELETELARRGAKPKTTSDPEDPT